MASKLRKSKKQNLAEASSDDSDDDSDCENTKMRQAKRKNKYSKRIKNLCDTDSDSDNESKLCKELYKSRAASSSRVGKKVSAVISISDSSNASDSDSNGSRVNVSKPNTRKITNKKRKSMSFESNSQSSEKSTVRKKVSMPSKNKLSTSKDDKKNQSWLDNDSSSSKEFQEPKKKRKSILEDSIDQYEMQDYSVISTPSKVDEEKITVEMAQEISFKHYFLEERKKFQKVHSKLHDDLQLNIDYLCKKKIDSVRDAKFFVHKMLTLYENTFSKYQENRREFIKTYKSWMDSLCKKPKEKQNRFSLSSNESDIEVHTAKDKEKSINSVTRNGKLAEEASLDKSNNRPTTSKATTKDHSADEMLSGNEAAIPTETNKNSETSSQGSKDSAKPSLEEQKQSRLNLKAKSGLASDKDASAVSRTAAEESEIDDSPMQVSGCDSDLIFSSEESKSRRRNKDENVSTVTIEKVNAKNSEVDDARPQSSDSEDLFETSTGEVSSTPVMSVKKVRVCPNDEDADKMVDVAEISASPLESNESSNEVEDPKEREALQQLLTGDNSDMDADSEDEQEEEGQSQAKSAKKSSSTERAARTRAKILTKQTKKRNLLSSGSSSSDDGIEARPKRRARINKSAEEGAASLRTATAPRKKHKFVLRTNRFYLADEKLRQNCQVAVERLSKSELAKHAEALDKSKNYVERKKIQSLANLDNLESKTKSKTRSRAAESSESDAGNDKESLKKSKAKQSQKEKPSLVDYLDKKSPNDSAKSSDEKDDRENHTALTAGDDSMEQSLDEEESKAKEALLGATSSSSSDEQVENETKSDDDSEKKNANRVKDKNDTKTDDASNDDSGEDETVKKDKGTWRKDKLLTFNLDGSESEEETLNTAQEKKKGKHSETANDKSLEEASPEKKPKKSRKTRRIFDSDSDVQSVSGDTNANSSQEESNQDKDEEVKKKKRRRCAQSSDSTTSSSGHKLKAKRRRIKKVASDSESETKESPGKSRKNIRKVLKDKYITDDTKKAAQDEEERLKRIAERQKLFNAMYESRLADEKRVEKLVLDIDKETKEELVVVDQELVKRLKPHQARGIKFMWDACYESIEQIEKSEGSGCIIAHCMGLGKTFQVVTLAYTLLTHEKTGVRTVMIVCPLSTVLNWVNEFKIWLKHVKGDEVEIFEMTKLKKNIERKCTLENWRNYGGVLIIGYEMFRNLTSTGKKMKKSMQESVMKSLVDPGADLVVCDEGHLLKNEDSALSKAMKLVKTMRRIVLTGTPLQNNLKEYHCMVQFVKPNLLGTKKEFLNRFVNPITNGQFDDSTPFDVKLMKKRAHVLHKMLEGSVQRFDYSVLTPFLPPKQEYVIFLRLTEVQIKLYQHYLDNFSRRLGGRNVSLFADFQALQRIWTHPYVLHLNAEKVERANEKKRLEASDSEGSLKDFIDDDSSEASSRSTNSSNSDVECLDSDSEKDSTVRKRGTRANPLKDDPVVEPVEETPEEAAWWSQFVDEQHFNDLRISTKLMLLFAILKESESIGDKVLVFSQSLYSLTLIEHFLNLMDDATQTEADAEPLNGHTGCWSLGMDYFRLDGSTSAENRSIWSKIFNDPKNTRARLFLISTRAGGLGINLIGANRVIIFDASWNPSHDVQSIFRIYRFGQKKPCYVYRLLAAGTMEEKIYNRQVTKLSLACRVVDEQQIERHYSNTDLAELYQFDTCEDQSETLTLPTDRMLAEIFIKYKDFIVKCHEHHSLLENKEEEELDEEERKQAWVEYEQEKKGIRQQVNMGNNYAFNQMLMNMSVMPEFQGVKQMLQNDYPDVPPEHLDVLTRQAMFDIYRMVDQQTALNSLNNFGNQQPMQSQNAYGTPTIQDAIVRQQNTSMNQLQPNYFGVNQMPVYSGRGRPPKYTSVNNQIVSNPMYLANALQAQQQSVPNDNDIQILDEPSVTSSTSK